MLEGEKSGGYGLKVTVTMYTMFTAAVLSTTPRYDGVTLTVRLNSRPAVVFALMARPSLSVMAPLHSDTENGAVAALDQLAPRTISRVSMSAKVSDWSLVVASTCSWPTNAPDGVPSRSSRSVSGSNRLPMIVDALVSCLGGRRTHVNSGALPLPSAVTARPSPMGVAVVHCSAVAVPGKCEAGQVARSTSPSNVVMLKYAAVCDARSQSTSTATFLK